MYKNILVNAPVNLGDVVLTTSALSLIKKISPTRESQCSSNPSSRTPRL